MSEYFDRPIQTLRDDALGGSRRHYYPPPQDVNQYASRALPLPPTRPQSYSSSIYDPEEAHSLQHTPQHLSFTSGLNNSRKRSTFGGGIDDDTSAMVELPEIVIPGSESYEYPPLVSPRPQRPDSKLLSMWANGDDLVSPIATPVEASWVNHMVSPLSVNSERWSSSRAERAPIEYESWFDDTSSDEEDAPDSSAWAQNENRFPDDVFPGALRTQLPRTNLRYSDPCSPVSLGLDWDFGEPGPDVGGLYNAPGRQTAQPQMYAPSTHSGDEQSRNRDSDVSIGEPKIAFAVYKIDTFSSNRHRASQIRIPPPLQLRGRSAAHQDYVKTPFPLRTSSVSSQRSIFKPDGSSTKQEKRRSGLGGFSSLRRPSAQGIRKPPGFTEILSQIDYEGTAAPVPRVKNILSKMGIARADSKKEKRREEASRQIHLNTE
ncbi:hypothetical protein F4803DRAFT_181247 [Xylaria telfairii]|nr:hypothetical protein F4803DRAFT_181247 [Xylaria telfairii]